MMKVKRKNPKGLDDIVNQARRMGSKRLSVGVPNGGTHSGSGLDMLLHVAVHELGSIKANVPARPFIAPSMQNNSYKYAGMMAKDARKILLGRKTTAQVLDDVGAEAVKDIKTYIRIADFKPLAPATIAAKGSSKPLIDSGEMMNAIDYEVK